MLFQTSAAVGILFLLFNNVNAEGSTVSNNTHPITGIKQASNTLIFNKTIH